MKIFLVGFMGSGKTTLGRKLSKQLNVPFFDLDHVIEEKIQTTIGNYFSTNGEESFRKLERETLQNYPFPEHAVISTGGGSPCFFDNMEWMNQNGTTIYLSLSPAFLASRLENGKEVRPLIKGMDHEQLIAFISSKLEEREGFYKRAKHIINGGDHSLKQVLEILET